MRKQKIYLLKMGLPIMETMDNVLKSVGEGLKGFNNFLSSMGLGLSF